MSKFASNRENSAIQDWLKEDTNCWIAIASAFLKRNEREVAIAKLTDALRYQLRDGPPLPDTLGGRLLRAGSLHIHYHAVAVHIALAAETNNSSLLQTAP